MYQYPALWLHSQSSMCASAHRSTSVPAPEPHPLGRCAHGITPRLPLLSLLQAARRMLWLSRRSSAETFRIPQVHRWSRWEDLTQCGVYPLTLDQPCLLSAVRGTQDRKPPAAGDAAAHAILAAAKQVSAPLLWECQLCDSKLASVLQGVKRTPWRSRRSPAARCAPRHKIPRSPRRCCRMAATALGRGSSLASRPCASSTAWCGRALAQLLSCCIVMHSASSKSSGSPAHWSACAVLQLPSRDCLPSALLISAAHAEA